MRIGPRKTVWRKFSFSHVGRCVDEGSPHMRSMSMTKVLCRSMAKGSRQGHVRSPVALGIGLVAQPQL
jgi:hypothetical protein